jgi:nucleotide-binding universal stress UspA family protein
MSGIQRSDNLKVEIRQGGFEVKQRIVVPLDGTKVGEAVLPKLEDLVLRTVPVMDTEVTLLRVISKMNFNTLTEDEDAQLPLTSEDLEDKTREAHDYLEEIAAGFRNRGIQVKTMVTSGQAAQEIVKAARSINANLIAMSTSGRSGVVRWAIGSVTDRVMRLEGKIPVLAVKATEEKTSPVISMESLQSLMKHS